MGAAAWSSGDSASAARAWQRALRLDALDAESRERLDAFVPPILRATGYVAPVPVDGVALLALAAWTLAWLLFALPPRVRPPATRGVAGGAVSIAVVLLLASLELNDRLDARGLGVLRQSRALAESPGSSTALAGGTIGETARLGVREGAWVRITIDANRSGWVPVASVLPLDAPAGE